MSSLPWSCDDQERIPLWDVEAGVSAAIQHHAAWCDEQLRRSAGADGGAALAELRAFGLLTSCGAASLAPRPRESTGAPDFVATLVDRPVVVEVHDQPGNGVDTSPSPESGGKRLASLELARAFAAIEPRTPEAAVPSVLWLDMMGWAPVGPSMAEPFSVAGGAASCGGLWHAFYGTADTLIFDEASMFPSDGRHARQAFDGLFSKRSAWSVAVLSMVHGTIVFENPNATHPMTSDELCLLARIKRHDRVRSRVSTGPTEASTLLPQIALDRERLGAFVTTGGRAALGSTAWPVWPE